MQEFEVRDDIENIIYILITILLNEADWSTWWIIALYLSFGKRRVGWMMIWMKKIPFYSDFQNTCLLEIGGYGTINSTQKCASCLSSPIQSWLASLCL